MNALASVRFTSLIVLAPFAAMAQAPRASAVELSGSAGPQTLSMIAHRLIRIHGSFHSANQAPVVGARFSIYGGENGGTPIWTEIQNVRLDKDGNYTALLGSTEPEGIPADLFITTEPRWLEVEIEQINQPRILLVSVPYALKAADADTLGGLPASAFLRASSSQPSSANSKTGTVSGIFTSSISSLSNNGSPGCIGMFTNTTDLICAALSQSVFQNGPAVSIGAPTTYYGAMTLVGDVPNGDAAGMALYNAGAGAGASVSLDMYNTPSNGGIPQAKIKAIDDGAYSDHLTFWTKNPGGPGNSLIERLRISSNGNVGVGTTTPSYKLSVAGDINFTGNLFQNGSLFSGWSTSGSNLFYNNGNVGIGTSTPSQKLEVNGNLKVFGTVGTNGITLGTNSITFPDGSIQTTALIGSSTSQWTTNGSSIYYNSGNVGIGATTPGQKLEVNGNLMVDSNIILSGDIYLGNLGTRLLKAQNNQTAVGINSLAHDTMGSANTAMGGQALFANTTGSNNVAVGESTLSQNTTGFSNTAIGRTVLVANTVGVENTGVGFSSLANTTGSDNTAIGVSALFSNTTGSFNVGLGYNSGTNLVSGSDNIYIANAGGTPAESRTIRIGSPDTHSATFIAGISGVNVSGVPVLVSSSGQLGVASSSRRFKQDIEDMGNATDNLMRLRPVSYRYKQPFEDGSQPLQYGLIAEEVAEVYPELVAHSADGKIETVKYQMLDSMLLNELQKQNATITAQKEEIRSLQERLSRLESLVERSGSR